MKYLTVLKKKKMNKLLYILFFCFLAQFLAACALQESEEMISPSPNELAIEYSFSNGTQGWQGDFCDYDFSTAMSEFDFAYEHKFLPPEINSAKPALRFRFDNVSNDLFVFAKNRYDLLEPSTLYEVTFSVEIASKYPENGAGNAISLKAGASPLEPAKTLSGNYIGINLLKGNHQFGGGQASYLGSAGILNNDGKFALLTRSSNQKLLISSDSRGSMWLVVGFDSQYGAYTELYVNRIRIFLKKVS